MITKTLALLLSISLSVFSYSETLPMTVPVDINFCDYFTGESDNICTISESENGSRNKIIIDQSASTTTLLIDKRNLLPEKADYIFSDGHIIVNHTSIITLPYVDFDINIEAGKYPVKLTDRGYFILLDQKIPLETVGDIVKTDN